MSFLNASHSFFNNGGDIFLGQACKLGVKEVEGSFRFSDELGPEDFMEVLGRRLEELEREVACYESAKMSKKQTKAFLVSSAKRLNHISDVVVKYCSVKQPSQGKRLAG